MIDNKTFLFILILLLACLLIFFVNFSNEKKVPHLSNTLEPVPTAPEKNNQLIIPVTPNLSPPKANRIKVSTNDDYIVTCESESLIEEPEYFREQQQYLNSLYDSPSQDRLLEYVLFAEIPENKTRLELLLEYNQEAPNHPLVMMEAVSLCSNSSNPKCNKNFIDAAINADSDNGAMWLSSALYFAAKNNDQAVIESISELTKTSVFNQRYGERIGLYAQALAGSNSADYNTNVASGIGIEAARSAGYSHIFNWCKNGVNNIEKNNACLSLGRNLENRSKKLISQLVGISIQKFIHQANGNTEILQSLEKKSEQLKTPLMNEQFYKASFLMFYHEELLRNWLNNLDIIGEVESGSVLIEEAISVSQEKGLSLCTIN